jgi:NADPH-dependent curcumin reductase CurA
VNPYTLRNVSTAAPMAPNTTGTSPCRRAVGATSFSPRAIDKVGARVVVCGTASVSSWDPMPQGPRVERHLLVKRARMQGFVIFDHADHFDAAYRDLSGWLREGRLRYLEDVLDGIEHAPGAIAGLYRGENLGKRLIRIAPE